VCLIVFRVRIPYQGTQPNRPALTDSMAANVAASVVQSRLDYANALLYGTPAGNIHKLHAVCTELLVPRCSASSPRLSQQQTLTSSLASSTQVASVQNCPPNIQEFVNQSATIPRNLLHMYQPLCCLRSASQNHLPYPFCTTNFSKRSFSFSAPTIWNELPAAIRESNTLDTFKHPLKTHLASLITCNHLSPLGDCPRLRFDLVDHCASYILLGSSIHFTSACSYNTQQQSVMH